MSSSVESKNRELMRRAVDSIDLKYCNRAEGESEHDYEVIYLWYKKDPLYRGPGPRNSDLCIKLRCKNCGRIISASSEMIIELFRRYEKGSMINNRHMDFVKLCRDYDSYELPEGIGPFSVRYIHDDGTAEIRDLGYGRRGSTIRISRMEVLPGMDNHNLLTE